ncbi:MAG: alpha-E domain-containing protein [Halioglobus sp.]|nr:alpha-E domain-containing protein [Halioglobus sp.]
MMMLSRVAERLYWMARYLERAEDTARLTKAYTHLIMDIPAGSEPGWDILVRILDAQAQFSEHHRACNEQNVLKFLIAEEDNPGSVHFCVRAARENVRTTRDVLPEEVWEHVNGLYLFSQEHAAKSVGRRNRHQFLDQVITRCQMISGLLMSTLCRDHAYRFIKLGALLERADMTTRIIDVGAGALLGNERLSTAVDPLIWASLLQSLSAMGTYRRTIGPLVEASTVVNFVFREPTLPRSVRFCLDGIRRELLPLTHHEAAIRVLDQSLQGLEQFNAETAERQQLHDFIDHFQLELNTLGNMISSTWFMSRVETSGVDASGVETSGVDAPGGV